MSRSTDKKKVKLQKDDLQTFYRLLSFAKPYFWRLVIGSVCSVLGGGSILAILLTGKSLIGFIIESPTFSFTEDVPAMEASAFAVDEAG